MLFLFIFFSEQPRNQAVRHLWTREQPHRGGRGDVHHPQGVAREALRRRQGRLGQPAGAYKKAIKVFTSRL